jgi:hypothetical protein
MCARDGYLCANLVNPNRPKRVDSEQPTTEEEIAAADGSFAYCARYEIDVKRKQIVHLPEEQRTRDLPDPGSPPI